MNKYNRRDRNIMSTTNDKKEKDPLEWDQWGKKGEKQPGMKDLIELMIQHTNARKNILEETKKWLLQNGKSKH